jgi:hypothetical protein
MASGHAVLLEQLLLTVAASVAGQASCCETSVETETIRMCQNLVLCRGLVVLK